MNSHGNHLGFRPDVRITDDKLTLLVEPLTGDQRLALLDRIRAAEPNPSP